MEATTTQGTEFRVGDRVVLIDPLDGIGGVPLKVGDVGVVRGRVEDDPLLDPDPDDPWYAVEWPGYAAESEDGSEDESKPYTFDVPQTWVRTCDPAPLFTPQEIGQAARAAVLAALGKVA